MGRSAPDTEWGMGRVGGRVGEVGPEGEVDAPPPSSQPEPAHPLQEYLQIGWHSEGGAGVEG